MRNMARITDVKKLAGINLFKWDQPKSFSLINFVNKQYIDSYRKYRENARSDALSKAAIKASFQCFLYTYTAYTTKAKTFSK